MAADLVYCPGIAGYGLADGKGRQEAETQVAGSPGEMERHDVATGRDVGRTAHHQGFHSRRQDGGPFQTM